jgi:CDP-paratose 2-epimerase
VRKRLESLGVNTKLWITQTGFSTWRGEESAQARALADAMEAPVERIYWQSAHDRIPAAPGSDSFHSDEREYHYGLKRIDGSPKLLFRLWSESGLDGVREAARSALHRRNGHARHEHVLITGGAGFIGTNLADRLLQMGRPVLIYDDLSRPGVERNLAWLREQHGDRVQVEAGAARRGSLGRAGISFCGAGGRHDKLDRPSPRFRG